MLKVILILPFMILAVIVSYIVATLALFWMKNPYKDIPKIPYSKLFSSDRKLVEEWIKQSTRSYNNSRS